MRGRSRPRPSDRRRQGLIAPAVVLTLASGGFIMAAAYLLEQNPSPSDDDIRKGLEGNLCRCTGYVNIVKAVRSAAATMGGTPRAVQPAGTPAGE